MTDVEKQAYAREVWSEFWKRAKGPERLMSPVEWSVLKSWLDEPIPLRIVLRAMDDTRGSPGTLRYYEGPVRAAYERWRASLYT